MILFLSVSLISLSGENMQYVIPVNNPCYQYLDLLFLEQGTALSFSSRPFNIDEMALNLKCIEKNSLSEAGKILYDRIEKEIKRKSRPSPVINNSLYAFDFSGILNLEIYYKTDPEIPWKYGYRDRLPMIEIPMEAYFKDNFFGFCSLAAKENPGLTNLVYENHTNWFSTEHNIAEIDGYFPFRAFIAGGGPGWSIQFGRDNFSWGYGESGNLLLSDNPDFQDGLRASFYSDTFKFSALYMELDAYPDSEAGEVLPDGKDAYKAFMGHMLELTLFNRVNLAISEAVIYGGKYPDLRNLNPIFIFHNWYIAERANSLLNIEIGSAIFRNFYLYGQFALDDLTTVLESWDRPATFGYLIGGELTLPLNNCYLALTSEWAHMDPWLYNHDSYLTTFSSRRRLQIQYPENADHFTDQCIGYFTGSDAEVLYLNASLYLPGIFYQNSIEMDSISLDFYFISKGELKITDLFLTAGEGVEATAPSGIPEESLILSLKFSTSILSWLKTGANISLVNVKNYDHQLDPDRIDFQLSLFCSTKFNWN